MKSFVDFIRKFKVIQIVLGIALLFAISYTVVGVLAARKKIQQLDNMYQSDKPMQGNDLPRIFEIRKENAFTEARLNLSQSDSVSLVIDLVDSTVSLDLKGLAIHKAKMVDYNSTSILKSLSHDAQLNMIGNPMKVTRQYSTLVKEPGTVKKAPKDTIEAAQQEELAKKDTIANLTPSFYYFGLNNGMEITFIHEHEKGHSYFPLFLEQKKKLFKATIDSMKHFKLPDYVPEIQIELSKTDATTIYRALPNQALVVIRL